MIKKVIIGLLIAGGLFLGSAFVVGMIEGIKSGISGTTTTEATEEVKEQPKEEIKEEPKEEVKEEPKEEVKEEQPKEEFNEKEFWENHYRENIKEVPEANTTKMIDYQIARAKVDIIDLSDEEQKEIAEKALEYIQLKALKYEYFKDNETMETLLYYGAFLEEYFQEIQNYNSIAKEIREIGSKTLQLVKGTYRGTETVEDIGKDFYHERIIKGFAEINKLVNE